MTRGLQVVVRGRSLAETYDLAVDFLGGLEVLNATCIEWVTHLAHHRAVTVTFLVLHHAVRFNDGVVLLLGDDLMLLLDVIFLRADVL